MNENVIGKEVVDAAVKVHRELGSFGFLLNLGSNPMKEGIERIVNGLPEQNLGVLAPWREIRPERVDSRQAAKTQR